MNIFETRQRAEELMKAALAIWRSSDQSNYLEGLENDPVFSVIMSALAYQANDIDNEIEQLKSDIVEEFEKTLSTGATGNAVPATVVMQTNAKGTIPVEIDSTDNFSCNSGQMSFISLFRSRIFNISKISVDQIDGRRWLVDICFPEPVDSLDGMTFAISELPYHNLKVSMMDDGNELPVNFVAPWDVANMPMSEPFSMDTLLYNRTHSVVGGGVRGNISEYHRYCAMDIFARQNMSLYIIKKTPEHTTPLSSVKLVFEFEGIGKNFVFNSAQVAFNVLILANAKVNTATISSETPVIRLTNSESKEEFLYLLRPDSDQIYSSLPLVVRRVNTDRFNRSKLIRLLNNLVARFHSDYYAFQHLNSQNVELQINRIVDAIQHLHSESTRSEDVVPGVYLMMQQQSNSAYQKPSLNVRYLTTQGASANDFLTQSTSIAVPMTLDESKSRQIVAPQLGMSEIRDEQTENSLRRYLLTTNDRLVTSYDLKLFCYNELLSRYNIVRSMVTSITVNHRRFDQGAYHTYQIFVEITLAENNFVKRAFEGKTETVENYLQRMMQVRSANIYPIKVKLNI